MSDKVPGDLRYTKDHEWAKVAAGEVTVGITGFAVEQLGDITLVTLDVKVGDDWEGMTVRPRDDVPAPDA